MIPGLSKQSITIGSAANCDISLQGPGIQPEHARITKQADGLHFESINGAPCTANGQAVAAGTTVPFDFRTPFTVAQTPVPVVHPLITLMLLRMGQAPPAAGQIIFGRDPARVHVVIDHPNASGLHATVSLNPLTVTDNQSTAGTWVDSQRLPPNAPSQLTPNAITAMGPIPFSVPLLQQLAASLEAPTHAPPPSPAALAAAAGAVPGAPASASSPKPSRAKHKTIIGHVSMGMGEPSVKTIGRTPENDIQVENVQVSSHHAFLHKIGDQFMIEDRGSANGTYVRGERLAPGQKVKVGNGEKVFVGPMPLLIQTAADEVDIVVEDSESWEGRPLYEIEAWDLVIQVNDRDQPGTLKTLLDHVSFKALPGDFIALMGPSGAGKTTLLLTLNGYLPPTAGQVRINGENLYAIYDNLRGSIGYVPQDDIVHPELTVWEAVRYSAKFRLPPDYSDEEIDRRVLTTLQQLGLESVMHLQIGKPEKKILSGGQRKRVNIAMELVTDPVIMFLDEPTSGLAADDTTALVSLLADFARETGKTIITTIHQPAKDEFEKFNLALIMGQGGIPMFYGPTSPDAYRFFGSFREQLGKLNDVDNPRDMFDMLNQREQPMWERVSAADPTAKRETSRFAAAREWHDDFFKKNDPTFQNMYSGRRAVGTGGETQALPSGRPKTNGQFRLLLSRYARIKTRDIGGTAIMLAQAPIIGVLLAVVFGGQKDAMPYWCLGALQELSKRSGSALEDGGMSFLNNMQTTPDNSGAIFFLVVASVWFGTSNAAREIVSERAIYMRERMVNLGLLNYVLSKFLLLAAVCLIQCTVLLTIVFFSLDFNGGMPAFGISLFTMVMTAMNSVALGLLLSAIVDSSEAAMALTPIALIPQVVLGGLMVPLTTNELLRWPMMVVPARWGFQGVVAQERMAIQNDPAWVIDMNNPKLNSADNFVVDGKFHCAEAQIASDNYNGAWGFTDYTTAWLPPLVLGTMMFILFVGILISLKRRDTI
ncbi:MAG: ATP-binding cassette domain-containing protein [Polyangiaceae bacterium]|nr:ATP-binding cassette domain-containing protein [Polyangiaceae bacterium]